jgi:arylsulfatase A-like enzyme
MRVQLCILALLWLVLSLTGVVDAQDKSARQQPNIILILADDLDAHPDTMATMPNLQQLLVAQGASFMNAIVPIALCCPSRMSLLSGQFAHNHDIVANAYPEGGFLRTYEFGLEEETIATTLQTAGYHTALIGKYLNGYPSSQGAYIPPGWDEWAVLSGGMQYYNYTLNENGTLVPYGTARKDYLTDVLTNKTVNFLDRMSAATPFFLLVAPYTPHDPAAPAYRHRGLFADAKVPRSPAFNEADVSDKPTYVATLPRLSKTQIEGIDELYRQRLRALQAVDELIGQIVLKLEEAGLLENTYLLFTNDNGYHLGQHRLERGKQTPYEEAIHVPLIVRGPGVPVGVTRPEVVSNIDLAPTFAELAGLDPFSSERWDGRSLLPLLRTSAKSPPWRQVTLFEHPNRPKNPPFDTSGASEDPDEVIGPTSVQVVKPEFFGLRTARYKYVEYATGELELYDLSQDPSELDNLAASADSALLQQFSIWLGNLKQCAGASCRLADAPEPDPTPLPTLTTTPTGTPTATEKATFTATASVEATDTSTATSQPTHTITRQPTATATFTPPIDATATSQTVTPTPSPTLPIASTPLPTPPPKPCASPTPDQPCALYLPLIQGAADEE